MWWFIFYDREQFVSTVHLAMDATWHGFGSFREFNLTYLKWLSNDTLTLFGNMFDHPGIDCNLARMFLI